jgi:hypothetical protein
MNGASNTVEPLKNILTENDKYWFEVSTRV